MKVVQKRFYDTRFSFVKRGLSKLQIPLVLFYDMRLIEMMLKISKVGSINYTLEVGCGQGTDAVLISRYTQNLVAMDISLHALKVAKTLSRMNNSFEKISFVAGDAEHLPFRESLFDIVFCKDLLHHVPNSSLAILEMKRVAKIAGKVVAIEANACNLQMILIGLIYFSVDKGVFKNTKAKLITIFRKAGFSDVNAEETEFLPRHLLFEYRSPLCLPVISKSKLILKVLSEIEDRMQNSSLIKNFLNYIIIHGVKKHE